MTRDWWSEVLERRAGAPALRKVLRTRGTAQPPEADGETFQIRVVLPRDRTPAWIKATAADLKLAAEAWKVPFMVDEAAIGEKLVKADTVAVLESKRRVIGFVAAQEPRYLIRTGLSARYVEGTIVWPGDMGGRGKFTRLMDAIGERCAIEVAHTQSVHMYEAIEHRNAVTFPVRSVDRRLRDALVEDMTYLLEEVNRTQKFDVLTGIVRDLYEHRLYELWPFPANVTVPSFNALPDENSGVLVVGFASARVGDEWLTYQDMHKEGR